MNHETRETLLAPFRVVRAFRGKHIEPMGENVGAVNFYQFGNIASVVETPGFLELPDQERDGAMSSVGSAILEIEFLDGSTRTISRAGLFEPPIFWAVAKLTESMLELVKWRKKSTMKQ